MKRTNLGRNVILFLAVFVLYTSLIFAQEADPFALILSVKGEVILNHNQKLISAESGTLIFSGDILTTKDNSLAVIRFSDNGAITKLFSNGTLTVNLEKKDDGLVKKLKFGVGDLWSNVKDEFGSYSVETPTSVAAIKGTKFLTSVEAETGYSTIYVYAGSIEFRNEFGVIDIPAGNRGFSSGLVVPTSEPSDFNEVPQKIQKEIKAPIEIPVEQEKIKSEKKEKIEKSETQTETQEIQTASAETIPKSSGEKSGSLFPFPMTGGIGSVTIDNLVYSQIRLMPEFRIWKFGIGLDLEFLIDGDGKLRKEDWQHFDDYLNKFLYLQFAQKSDPFYFRLGGFPKVKFGQGLIMRDYTNMLNYPSHKQSGVEIAAKPRFFNLDKYDFGFDIFCPNVYDLDIFAGRIEAKPFKNFNIPFVKNIKIGLTGAADFNQLGAYEDNLDNYTIADSSSVSIIGLDYSLPVLTTKLFSLRHYGEGAQITDYGNGLIFPGFGAHFLIFDMNLEYRFFDKEFEPNYFSYLYDAERAIAIDDTTLKTKKERLEYITATSQGWRGALTSNIGNIFDLSVAYEDMKGSELGKSIYAQLDLKKTFIPKLSHASARYSQTNVEDFRIWKSPTASLEAQVGYFISPGSLLIINYKERYEEIEDDELETITSYSFGVQFEF